MKMIVKVAVGSSGWGVDVGVGENGMGGSIPGKDSEGNVTATPVG